MVAPIASNAGGDSLFEVREADRHNEPDRNPPVLSVAIPTYNRVATLRRQLACLLGQIIGCGEDVEVVVSDNASSDGTGSVVEEMRSSFPGLRYVRNDTNVGLLHNVDRAVRACRAEYVWIVSDDDVLMPFALETVIGVVRAVRAEPSPVSFICLNAFRMAADNAWVGASSVPPGLSSDVMVSASEVFLAVDYTSLGHITRIVVCRRDWIAWPFIIDGPWAAYGYIKHLMVMSKNRACCFVGAPVVGDHKKHSPGYYINHIAIADCIELPSYDLVLLDEWGVPRRAVARVQRRRWRATLRAYVKVNLFAEYERYWPQVDAIRLITLEAKAMRLICRIVLRNRRWTLMLRRRLEPRLQKPIASDKGLHEFV